MKTNTIKHTKMYLQYAERGQKYVHDYSQSYDRQVLEKT